MINNIELLEPESTVKEGASVSRNQIKTKPVTFERIKSFFNNWRLSRNKKKLEKKQDEFKNLEFQIANEGGISKKDKETINRKATKIAEIEKKIKVLKHENVPASYVKNRALKIKNKMMSSISATSDGIYKIIDEEEKKKLFEREEVKPITNPVVPNNREVKQSEIDVEKTSVLNKETITSEIEEAMSGIPIDEPQNPDENQLREMMNKNIEETTKKEEEADKITSNGDEPSSEEKPLAREEIENVINSNFVESSEQTQEQENKVDDTNNSKDNSTSIKKISPSAVAKEVGATQNIQTEEEKQNNEDNNSKDSEVTSDEINEEEIKPKTEIDDNPKIDKISRNEATAAKVQKYANNNNLEENVQNKEENVNENGNNEVVNPESVNDGNGIEPLSDQQIKEMIKDLEEHFINPYKQSINSDNKDDEVIREVPVVAPEREKNDKTKNTSVTTNDEPISNEEVEKAKRSIAESQLRIEKAEERQRITKKRWQEKEAVRQKKEEQEKVSVQTVNSLFEKLRERIEAERVYADALEDDCEYNENKAREEEEKERKIDTRIADNEAKAEELLALLESFEPDSEKETKGKTI